MTIIGKRLIVSAKPVNRRLWKPSGILIGIWITFVILGNTILNFLFIMTLGLESVVIPVISIIIFLDARKKDPRKNVILTFLGFVLSIHTFIVLAEFSLRNPGNHRLIILLESMKAYAMIPWIIHFLMTR